MKQRLATLVLISLLLWVLAAYPLQLLGGSQLVLLSAVALALCLIPTSITLAWSSRVVNRSAEQQLLMVLGGTGVRMGLVLAGGLGLYLLVPGFKDSRLWVCILIAYLATLSLEMLLLTGRPAAVDRP